MPVNGGESVQLTHSKTPVTVIAWRPDGQGLAYGAADEEPERKDEAKFEDAFEVGNNSYLERAAARPVHLWTVTVSGDAKRLDVGGTGRCPCIWRRAVLRRRLRIRRMDDQLCLCGRSRRLRATRIRHGCRLWMLRRERRVR